MNQIRNRRGGGNRYISGELAKFIHNIHSSRDFFRNINVYALKVLKTIVKQGFAILIFRICRHTLQQNADQPKMCIRDRLQ